MTVAVSVKVNDGLVLAADSAATLMGQDANNNPVAVAVYNNANKIFNLRKSLPIGLMVWGAGSIGTASMATLAKDLRSRLSGQDDNHLDWEINPKSYTIQSVADRVREFFFDEQYQPAFHDWAEKPSLGLLVGGYSPGANMAEEYQLAISSTCTGPQAVRPVDVCGWYANGQPDAIIRLLQGFDYHLESILEQQLAPHGGLQPGLLEAIRASLQTPLVASAMPVQDAIDLAEFLVDLTIRYSRFTPGAPTVGGPIEIAAITKYEGFKWIKRKYYFSRELNPEEEP